MNKEMSNCEAIVLLDHLIKSSRENTPRKLKKAEDLAMCKAISALWKEASKEEDFKKCSDFFNSCCIKGEEDYLQRYHKTLYDSKSEN
ncbi:MAG: hypothetical protein J6P16_01660 [Eubacterium sp.]|nr:hypothetical protein [Eubacterium sp.]